LDDIHAGKSYLCEPESVKSILTSSHKNLSLKLITQNIRSINCNIDKFEVLLSRIDINFDLYILTETWNSVCLNIPNLPYYDKHLTTINRNQNDGLVIYVRNGISCTVEEPYIQDASCLTVTFSCNSVVVALYRSPSNRNIAPFINSLDKLLAKFKSYTNIIIMGDINIDIKPNNEDPNSNEYLNLLATYGIKTGHTFPTRMGNCLDHSMAKSGNQIATLVLEAPLTDHSAVISCLNITSQNNKRNRAITARNKVNFPGLLTELESTNFEDILISGDTNWAAVHLVAILTNLLTKYTTKILVPRRYRCLKPWITPGLIRCMRNRDRMNLRCKREPNNEILNLTYRRYKNFCNDLLKRLKKNYERNELLKHSKNPKKTWDTLKAIVHIDKQKKIPSDLLRIGDTPQNSVQMVNDFFANIGKSLSDKIPDSYQNLSLIMANSTNTPVKSLVMLETNNDEVESIIMGLKNDSAVGCDNISNTLLKSCRGYIIPAITHVVNLSIRTGIFPDIFKISIVHPIHKGGARDCVNNYRPISVLPALSKVLEKVMNKRLLSFLDKEHLISDNQFGFRAGKSTADAISEMADYIAQNLDKKRKCLGIYLDLAKAFDTVSAPILLYKMERIGVRGNCLRLFESYLSQRFQRVQIGKYISSDCPVTYGVPQGSVLGPSLFLIYINDLCNMKVNNCQIFTFADDTALMFHGVSWEETRTKAESGLQLVMQWLEKSKLTLNISKTKFITFGITNKSIPLNDFKISAHTCGYYNMQTVNCNCRCVSLERVNTLRYLGVILDSTLTWIPHLHMLVDRCRKLIFIFKKLRHVGDSKLIKTVYYALIQSVLSYCIRVWGGAKKTHILKLERAQRALLKVMMFKPYRFPTSELYFLSDVLSVRQLFVVDTILLQHKKLYFSYNKIQTRRRDKVCTTVSGKTCFINKFQYFLGPYVYNKINKHLNIYPLNLYECRTKLVAWLKTQHYEDVENILKIIK
jgi:hypothetical protein